LHVNDYLKNTQYRKIDLECFKKNVLATVALATILVTVMIFLILLFMARRKDLAEEKDEHTITFVGSEDSFYHYEIRIKTGMYPYAGQYLYF